MPLADESRRTFRVLSIDGGGYLGLATAAFIRGMEAHLGVQFADRFDLFCGTSTGAILALGLASGRTGEQLTELYKALGKSVFGRKRPARGYLLNARYDNRPLRKVLDDEFQQTTLADLHQRGKYALVTAFNLTAGKPRLFKTDHSPNLTLHGKLRVAEVALASSSAPFYFPAVPVRNPATGVAELYCDGGVVANHPALLGFAEAVSELKWPPGDIRILSLSTPRTEFGEGTSTLHQGDRGLLRWGNRLVSMFIESGASVADQILRRLVAALPEGQRPLYERIELSNHDEIEMDCASGAATQALLHEGVNQSSQNPVRDRVARITN